MSCVERRPLRFKMDGKRDVHKPVCGGGRGAEGGERERKKRGTKNGSYNANIHSEKKKKTIAALRAM